MTEWDCVKSFLGDHEPAARWEHDSRGRVLCMWCHRPIVSDLSDTWSNPWAPRPWSLLQVTIYEEPW